VNPLDVVLGLLTSPVAARLDAVELVLPSGDVTGPPSGGARILPVVAAAVALTAAVIVWRASSTPDPGKTAFRRLASALRLSRADRRLITRLARAQGTASPVAALLSPHTREQGAAALGLSPARLAELTRRIPPLM
jgi:hypothetical protein